jgi:predicted transcriptional regulator
VLNNSHLARLSYVERLASEKYRGHSLPRGLALHDILLKCVEKVLTELSSEPCLAKACTYLKLVTNGATCREISKQLGLSREHVSRVYRKKAIELVTEEFLSVVKGK